MRSSYLALAFVLLIIGVCYFFAKSKHSNLSGLYSNFTPYMARVVSYRLSAIDCEPDKYYYKDQTLCLVCKAVDACFPYAWVDRGPEGMLMNPMGKPYLAGEYDNLTALHFYSSGIDKLLGCNELMECTDAKARIDEGLGEAIFTFFLSVDEINQRIKTIATQLGYDAENCTYFNGTLILSCDKLLVMWWKPNEVSFYKE